MSLVYNLFYGMVLVIYLLILGMSLNNPYKPARGFGWLIQDSLDMLSLLLLSFGGILAVLELIGPTAWLLSHRVADWMKMRSAMRHYLQGSGPPYRARGDHVMFSTPTRRLLFLALTTLASAMWLAKDHLPLW